MKRARARSYSGKPDVKLMVGHRVGRHFCFITAALVFVDRFAFDPHGARTLAATPNPATMSPWEISRERVWLDFEVRRDCGCVRGCLGLAR